MQCNQSVSLPYGKGSITATLPAGCVCLGGQHAAPCETDSIDQQALVQTAMQHPIESQTLSELAVGKKTAVILSSDHTRPVPSRILMPILLAALRAGNPEIAITILVATGCHRAPTPTELQERYGNDIVQQECIRIHDCDQSEVVDCGILPSGTPLKINRLVMEADLVVGEGFIEPHFFAGFSGGRKSVLPGVCARETVMANHCARHIASPGSHTGILAENPIHQEMALAAQKANLAFILNVVLDKDKRITAAFAGHPVQAHQMGAQFVLERFGVPLQAADIVIASNGGYPLDQNLYQSVKGMDTASRFCKENAIIIMASECMDGHGGAQFYQDFLAPQTPEGLYQTILQRAQAQTQPDQWQSQIFAQVLRQHPVYYVSSLPQEMVEAIGLVYCASLQQAIDKAVAACNVAVPCVMLLPDAVSVVPKEG